MLTANNPDYQDARSEYLLITELALMVSATDTGEYIRRKARVDWIKSNHPEIRDIYEDDPRVQQRLAEYDSEMGR